jgi:hypothetical protein
MLFQIAFLQIYRVFSYQLFSLDFIKDSKKSYQYEYSFNYQ